jgi:ABC-2 type transport system permease protein
MDGRTPRRRPNNNPFHRSAFIYNDMMGTAGLPSGRGRAPRIGTADWLKQTKAFFYRSTLELFRSRAALFWALAWPTIFYLLVRVFMLGSTGPRRASPSEMKALYAISLGMFGAFTVSFVLFARAFTNDLEQKRYRKIRSLPVAPSADLVGRLLGAFAFALVSFWFVVGVGYLDGAAVRFEGALAVPATVLGLFLFCLVGVSAAVLLASVMYQGEYFAAIANSVLVVLYFGTGFNGIGPGLLPAGTQWVVNWAPNALATRVLIHYLVDTDATAPVLTPPAIPSGPDHLLLLVGFAVVFLAVSTLVMYRRIYLGEGGE